MNAERVAELRAIMEGPANNHVGAVHVLSQVPELLDYIDELTRQRDDARRIAVDGGAFQNWAGADLDIYDQDSALQ